MTAREILEELQPLGSDGYKKVMSTYGVKEPFFGVKIGDMQPIRKRIRKDYQLALDLYATGNYDAMYLAGLIADDARMTRDDLQNWVDNAYCGPLCGSTVPSVAAGNPHGWELALEWIESDSDLIAAAGWATLACIVSVQPDSGTRSSRPEATPPAGEENHPSGTRCGALSDELVHHRGGLIRAATHRRCHPGRGKNRPCHRGSGRQRLPGALRPRLHRKGADPRGHWKKAQVRQVLTDLNNFAEDSGLSSRV
jgi:hypothetical protein